MKSLIGILVVSACLAAPAFASEAKQPGTAQSFTDFSSAKRKTTAVTIAPVTVTPPKSVWTGADPTVGPGTARLRQLQSEGRCVIDEGYGRYTACNNY